MTKTMITNIMTMIVKYYSKLVDDLFLGNSFWKFFGNSFRKTTFCREISFPPQKTFFSSS